MDYKNLIQDLLNLNPSDTRSAIKVAALLNDLTQSDTINLLGKIRDLEVMVNTINTLNPTVVPPDPVAQRDRFVKRIERLAECESLVIPPKAPSGGTPVIEPYFNQFDVIYCNFGGVGWEYDGPHFAVVWEDNHSDSEITVIPTTSQYTKEYADEFSVGRISGLPPKNTILSVKKLTRISRKRVINQRGKFIQGRLHRGWKDRIECAIAIAINLETPLDFHIRNNCGVSLPENINVQYSGIRFYPARDFSFDKSTMTVHYRKWNEATPRTLIMKNPNTFIKQVRKKHIYDNIFSNDPTRSALGMSDYNGLYV